MLFCFLGAWLATTLVLVEGCEFDECPSLNSRLSFLIERCWLFMFSKFLKFIMSNLSISHCPKLSFKMDFSSLKSQYIKTLPVIIFSLKTGVKLSITPFSSATCPNKFIKSSTDNLDRHILEISLKKIKICGILVNN